MNISSNDKKLKELAEIHGKDKVEEAYQKYSKIIFSEKVDNIVSFSFILIAYILWLLSMNYDFVVFGKDLLLELPILIITAFIVNKIIFDDLLKMPMFLIVIALALINIYILGMITGSWTIGILIVTVIVAKKIQLKSREDVR